MDYSGNNINIQNENYLNNNGMQMNQVNQNQFPLYFKMLQQTFQNMQPNINKKFLIFLKNKFYL